MYWKFTYIWWYSVCNDVMFVKADTREEAYEKFNSNFGYEDVDVQSCEQVTEDDILNYYVVK